MIQLNHYKGKFLDSTMLQFVSQTSGRNFHAFCFFSYQV